MTKILSIAIIVYRWILSRRSLEMIVKNRYNCIMTMRYYDFNSKYRVKRNDKENT